MKKSGHYPPALPAKKRVRSQLEFYGTGVAERENNKMAEKNGAIWLRREQGFAIVCIEHNGRWIEIVKESLSSHFSHIVEPLGIENCIREQTK